MAFKTSFISTLLKGILKSLNKTDYCIHMFTFSDYTNLIKIRYLHVFSIFYLLFCSHRVIESVLFKDLRIPLSNVDMKLVLNAIYGTDHATVRTYV
jgi:hypothetical protein